MSFDTIYSYQPRDTVWLREIAPLMRRIKKAKDDRAFVLVSALTVERQLDALLRVYLPRYSQLLAKNDLPLSIKIGCAQAIGLVPDRLLNFSNCIRTIRNDIVHNIKLDSLGDLSKRRKAQLIYVSKDLLNPVKKLLPRIILEAIVLECTLGLRLQRMNAEVFRKAIRSREFRMLLDKKHEVLKRQKELSQVS